MTLNSREHWAACEACYRLIQRGDREALARRSVKRYRKLYGGTGVPMLTLSIARRLQDAFWSNREGSPSRASATWD